MPNVRPTCKVRSTSPLIGVIPVAQHVQIRLVDDLDGSEAVDTVSFGLDGTEYEIDLNEEHIDQLRGGLMLYIKAARKVGAGPSRRQASAAAKPSGRDLG